MTDEYLLKHGYKQYEPTQLDHYRIVARFQKRFDDDIGKKYFINVIKWSNEYDLERYRGKFTYEYEVYVSIGEDDNQINFHFLSSWKLEQVEKFMEDFFVKMKPNYYERWYEINDKN